MSQSNLEKTTVSLELLSDFKATTDDELLESLKTQASKHQLRYLLSHHNDGVVWGRFEGQEWLLSSGRFKADSSPAFRAMTLQQCRAFGDDAELFIWAASGQLKASILREGLGCEMPYFEQTQLLWGTNVVDKPKASPEGRGDGFSLLREGQQGMLQIVPLAVTSLKASPKTRGKRLRLLVRHYIDYEAHQAYVKWSRLVKLDEGERA